MPTQRLFVIDSWTVLQDAFVAAVQTLKTADPLTPLTVLVPNDLLALHLRRTVAWAGPGHLGLRALTLLDFARNIAEDRLAQRGYVPLPPLAIPRIVKKLLSETQTSNYFAPLIAQPGFPHMLFETLNDLKQAEVRPHDVRLFMQRARLSATHRHRIESLAILYDGYTRFLQTHRLYDRNDLLAHALSLLETRSETTPLFLYGLSDLTPLQRRLLAAALQNRDVLAFFAWRSGSAYEYATPTLSWLMSLGLQYTPLATTTQPEHLRDRALVRIQARLFEEEPGWSAALESDSSVSVITAPGRNREAREIGRMILTLVQEHGIPFSDIGILLRDTATYGPLLTETLSGLGIPCFLSGGRPLIQTSAGQSLRLLCQVLAEDYSRSRVIEFLGTADVPFPELLGELAVYAQPAQWEALSLKAGIVKGAQEWRDRLSFFEASSCQHHLSGNPETHARQVLRAFRVFMQGFLTHGQSMSRVNTWQGWAERTLHLFRAYVSSTAETPLVEKAVRQLAQLDLLGEVIPIEEWARSVTAALTSATVETGEFGTEGVCIGDLLTTCGVCFRVVIVPGLVEGSFPRPVRQDPLLLDAERQHLGETLACELPQRGRRHEEERLAFCLATHSATERLILTYPHLDQTSGRTQVPSWYLLRVIEAWNGKPASLSDLEARSIRVPLSPFYTGPPSRAVDTIEFHLSSVERSLISGDPAPLGYLPGIAPFFSQALHAVSQRWDIAQFTVFDGVFENNSATAFLHRHLFPAGVRLSATDLETYARCPFRYFLSVVLRLTPREEPERLSTLQPRDRGILLHDILKTFFSQLRQAEQLPLATQEQTALQRFLRQVAEAHFQDFARTRATGFPLLWELEQEQLSERLAGVLHREYDARDDFLPADFEVLFGTEHGSESTPFFPRDPVRFTLENGEEIGLSGRIDRIDLSTDQRRARIIDYKTGKLPRGRFAGGMSLQLPVYLFAAQTLRPDLVWESASYTPVDRVSRGNERLFLDQHWSASLTTLRQILTVLVNGIRSGHFFPTPDTCSPCPFPSICGTRIGQRIARKQSDPRVARFCHMRAIP